MKLFENSGFKKPNPFPKFELTEDGLRKFAEDTFGKNYFQYDDEAITKKDLQTLLREQKICVKGHIVSSNIAGQKEIEKIIKSWGWEIK